MTTDYICSTVTEKYPLEVLIVIGLLVVLSGVSLFWRVVRKRG